MFCGKLATDDTDDTDKKISVHPCSSVAENLILTKWRHGNWNAVRCCADAYSAFA
jgi:hypothetical protein